MEQNLRSVLDKLASRIITDGDSEQDKLNKTLLIFACGLMGFAAMLWLVIYWAMGIKFSATVPLTFLGLSGVSLVMYMWNRDFAMFRFFQVSLFLFVPFIMQWSIGSYVSSSGVMLWALLAPLGVAIFQGAKDSLPWFAAYIVMTVVSGFFDFYLAEGVQAGVTMESIAVFFSLNFAAMSTIVYLLVTYFVRQREKLTAVLDKQNRLLMVEQEKSERLLRNILPPAIAARLKDREQTIADGFADVTVMFADIIDFTRMSEELPPEAIVALLNEIFSHFDQLAERYQVEKIKTIGDAYMVAGGLDEQHRDPVLAHLQPAYTDAICAMALDMLEFMRELSLRKNFSLQLHVGISTGPVVAGVIGMKKFIYDLWGDPVNLASRVTSEAGAGFVLVDTMTYKRMHTRFRFHGPERLMVKGKGEIIAYRLLGHAPVDGGQQPAPKAALLS